MLSDNNLPQRRDVNIEKGLEQEIYEEALALTLSDMSVKCHLKYSSPPIVVLKSELSSLVSWMAHQLNENKKSPFSVRASRIYNNEDPAVASKPSLSVSPSLISDLSAVLSVDLNKSKAYPKGAYQALSAAGTLFK
ncbi:hypothetical protein M9H77_28521 [Catharanthus roseus]|uniref:Uncharacterized protein n=1 Tax=Catharanthus roseus TaxID=4058 RepID=A0ACC0AFL0_CATRO|nr:hypothetical protein M9H77_28521 [Catharanthus roseus]